MSSSSSASLQMGVGAPRPVDAPARLEGANRGCVPCSQGWSGEEVRLLLDDGDSCDLGRRQSGCWNWGKREWRQVRSDERASSPGETASIEG